MITRRPWWQLRAIVGSLLVGFALIAGSPKARAVAVDTELLLLVDVSKSVSTTDFSDLMSAYADSFESSEVISAIQSGELGQIAASLVFYGDKNDQAVGLGWMLLSDGTDAQAFADLLRTASRPFDKNKTSIAEALDYAVPLFGDETGGAANGFESARQVIQVTADGIDDSSKKTDGSIETTVANARDAALSSGVDVISALTVGAAGEVDAYFTQYVVGGGSGGGGALVVNSPNFASITFGPVIQEQLLTPVPEPATPMALLLGVLLIVITRRRSLAGRN